MREGINMIINEIVAKINELQDLIIELKDIDERLFEEIYEDYGRLAEKTIKAFKKYFK